MIRGRGKKYIYITASLSWRNEKKISEIKYKTHGSNSVDPKTMELGDISCFVCCKWRAVMISWISTFDWSKFSQFNKMSLSIWFELWLLGSLNITQYYHTLIGSNDSFQSTNKLNHNTRAIIVLRLSCFRQNLILFCLTMIRANWK